MMIRQFEPFEASLHRSEVRPKVDIRIVRSAIRGVLKRSTGSEGSTAISSAIAEAIDLMTDEADRHHVHIDTSIEDDLPLVALDRVQVQQVLINLMRNGVEAMDAVTDERLLGVRAHRAADSVQIEVSDSGPGIELPGRIFEPFSTTKEQGMGMGRVICRSIVESHGGQLWVEQNQPRGSRFIFTLLAEETPK